MNIGTINEEGQPDGNGSMEYKHKNRYEGSWKNGVREGIGQFTPALGDFTYKGEYKNDKKEGEGVLTMKVRWGFVRIYDFLVHMHLIQFSVKRRMEIDMKVNTSMIKRRD